MRVKRFRLVSSKHSEKNNIEFIGKKDKDLIDDAIKHNVAEFPPDPDVPIFLLNSYPLQSYFWKLIR